MSKTQPPTNEGYEGLVQQTEGGAHRLLLLVSGVHCALCIQKIEEAINQHESVQSARLNFSTGRLSVTWQGDPEQANHFVDAVEALGYGVSPYNPDLETRNQDQENRFLLLCLGVAGFAMGNIMLLSVGLWSTDEATMGEATRTLLHWISALIAVPAIAFSGRPFFRSAFAALRHRQTNMDVPIAIALILAVGMSIFETINHGQHVYFDSAIMLMFFLLIGRYLDFRARRNARSAATDLTQTLAGFANVIDGKKTKRVLISDVKEGMDITVAAGEKIPVDGIVKSGNSMIDTSLITGETLPRPITAGEEIFAGTINQSAPLIITVTKSSENSLVADIVRLMEKAEQGQARYVRLADRAARLYTPIVHIMALSAFILWWGFWGVEWQDALLIAITVLIITCPCALGLAVPVVQVLATGVLMKRGVLVKSGDALERLARVDTVLLDKTGTLTLGTPVLIEDYDADYLKLAASLATHSRHPLSQALAQAYEGDAHNLDQITEHAGQGMSAQWQNKTIQIGSRQWCGDKNAAANKTMELWLSIDQKPLTCFTFEDQLREDAPTVIRDLKARNLDCVLLSGDRQSVANTIAKQAHIQTVLAEQTPTDKHAVLERYKAQGHTVLMIGDGLNDAPVLAGADISIAPGSAIDMAQNIADIIFMGDKLAPISLTHKVAQQTQKLVKQNFALAILYNCFAIPLAFTGLVTPMIAALAMSGSSLLVIANAYRLKLLS